MHILSILLFCFSANLDTFLIGLSCSLAGNTFPVRKNLLLSFICTAGTALAMFSGQGIGGILSFHTANLIGGYLLVILGVWFSIAGIRSVLPKKQPPAAEDTPPPETTALEHTISKEDTPMAAVPENSSSVLPLAIALSLNNFALGLGAGITGLPVFLTSLSTFAACFFLLLAGQWTGRSCLARLCGRYAGLISGLIILILGIYEIFI